MSELHNIPAPNYTFDITLEIVFNASFREEVLSRHAEVGRALDITDSPDREVYLSRTFSGAELNGEPDFESVVRQLMAVVPEDDNSISWLGASFSQEVDLDRETINSLVVIPTRPLTESLDEDWTEREDLQFEGDESSEQRPTMVISELSANGEKVLSFQEKFSDSTSAWLNIERNENEEGARYDIIGEVSISDFQDVCGLAGRARALLTKVSERIFRLREQTLQWMDKA